MAKALQFNKQCNTGNKEDPGITCGVVILKEFSPLKDGHRHPDEVTLILPEVALEASRKLKAAFAQGPDDGPAPGASTRAGARPRKSELRIVRTPEQASNAWDLSRGARQAPRTKKRSAVPVAQVAAVLSSPPKAAKPLSPQTSPLLSPPGGIVGKAQGKTPGTKRKSTGNKAAR